MSCPSCGRANRPGARFCGGCGRSLAPRCPACGSEREPGAQFCDACGASFVPHAADAAAARKVVTIVFADLAGSTSLHERLDAESTRLFMDRYYRAMQGAVEAQRGTVTQLLGDGVKAVFGAPRVAEDDALRAVRAAVDMQRAFRELASDASGAVGPVGLRVAVNTGEVVAQDETEIIGDPVNVAARLQQEAHDGDVLVGESTQRLVSGLVTLVPFGTFTLKGRAEPVSAYRVVSLERPAGPPAVAFVGRDDELRRLVGVFAAAVASPGARLAVILGSPGLGKSRLLDELGRRLGERATLLLARCDAAGGATFAPIAEALRTFLGVEVGAGREALGAAIDAAVPGDASERTRIADGVAALLSGAPESPEETFFIVRRLLAALATTRPVVLAIDDLQWAEPLLLDLTEHLVQWSSDAPLLVLGAARPELREARSSLAAPGGLVAEVVMLAGLDAGAATRLAANVIGADELPAAIAGRVLATSEGNPLFVGELVRMLVHDGALKREGDRWTAGVELAALEMPPTIHALLAARIERLRPEERTLLERAAVIGRHFSRAAVAQLLPPELRTELDARLESLRRSELIEPDTGWLLGEPMLRFHHVLIRDAAYRRLLKNTRAELHGRFADWLEAQVGEAVEHDETIGWHLEQAHQHLSELGPIDERGRAVGERAARHLAAAGRRALARDDLPLAASLLGRALDRLDPADPARADLALDWCEALLAAGEVGPAAGAIDELGRFSGGSDRLRAWHTCFAGQLAALTDPQSLRATADAVAAAAEVLASAGDAAGEAKAHSVHALALQRLGKVGACEAALDRALAAARRAHDRRRANAVLAGAPLAALWGPSPVTRASGRCLDVVRVLRITQGAPAVEAVALRCQAVLEALRGRTEAARRMLASSRRMVEELGIMQRLLEADVFAGLIELLEGDAVAAERELRAAYEGLRSHGLRIDAAQAAALLGRALLAQGRAAEAEAMSLDSEALAGDDLKAAIAWRGVRAEALARRGEHTAAVELARAAVELAAATDALLDHADARLALAAALRAAGRGAEADAEEKRAIELWEAKGATLLVERARREVEPIAQADRAPEDHAETHAVRRRVRPNAATANLTGFDAAVAARDVEALSALLGDGARTVHHATGVTYDTRRLRAVWSALFRAREPRLAHEPLATLGDSLALCRSSLSFEALADDDLPPFGAVERDQIVLVEADARGLRRGSEVFAADRLGDAVARLYERHAELLPDGPARARAAATARSVAAMPGSPSRWPFAPDVEATDHRTVGWGSVRGADTAVRVIRTLPQLSTDLANRIDDVLGLRSEALLVRWTNSGTDRASGGAFERSLCVLWVFGADGLVTRWEQFDADRDADALARFDELAGEATTSRFGAAPSRGAAKVHRRVRPNAATANTARLEAVIAAREDAALDGLFADSLKVVHHPTGAIYDREGVLFSQRSLLRARGLTYRHESLATLGDWLQLSWWSTSFNSLPGDDDLGPFGAVERENLLLIEVDSNGRQRRVEFFAMDRLGEAVARLYERCGEILPVGPERERAEATARSVATVLAQPDVDRFGTALAPAVEFADHRTLGFAPGRGAEALLRGRRVLLETSVDVANGVDDVLGARTEALLVRLTTSGTDRAGGGAWEKPGLVLWVFGSEGLVARIETFDADREAEALARFDELTTEPPATRRVRRRVRPNAATANTTRLDAAFAARDADALPNLFADDAEMVHHPTGAVYDRQGALDGWRAFLEARDGTFAHEPVATLGESLALYRQWASFAGAVRYGLTFGAAAKEEIVLLEVDARGRRQRVEFFATDRLGDAVACLYERYAELLPEGPARAQAAGTARAVAALLGPLDLDRMVTATVPAVEFIDRRTLGIGSAHGVKEFRNVMHTLFALAADVANRIDDVMALRSEALLARWTNSGTDRASGGAYERRFLVLLAFGSDGLVARVEQFDADRDVEALARFDELAAEPPAERFANAASRSVGTFTRCWYARDWEGVVDSFASGFRLIDRRSVTGLDLQGEDFLASMRFQFGMNPSRWHVEMLATRGERLALLRSRFESEDETAGPGAVEYVAVVESDVSGRSILNLLFDPDDFDAACAELDARYAAGEAAAHPRVAATMHAFLRAFAARDWEALAAHFTPDLVVDDHRRLGWETLRGPAAYVESLRSLVELAPDTRLRLDHVRTCERGLLWVAGWLGTREGGPFEGPWISVSEHDALGKVCRFDQYDLDQLDAALARYEELSAAAPPTARIENAATRSADRFRDAWEARDWERVAEIFAPGFLLIDRRTMMHLDVDRDQHLEAVRLMFGMTSSHLPFAVLATRGDRLALFRMRFEGSDRSIGASESEWVEVVEMDDAGRFGAIVMFDPDDLDAAYAELDDRYGAPVMPALIRAIHARDWDAASRRLAPGLVVEDHRRLGWETLRGPAEYIRSIRVLAELAPDSKLRVDHAEESDRGSLGIVTLVGTREGGAFEMTRVVVAEFDAQRRVRRFDFYDLDQLGAARARYEAIRASAPRDPLAALARPNAASAAMRRVHAADEARDWAAVRALCAPDARIDDRRRHALLSGDTEWWIADMKRIAEAVPDARYEQHLVGTAGDRVALERLLWTGAPDGGRFEIEYLWLTEVDEAGRIGAAVAFDLDDRRAAGREARVRWLARDAAAARVAGPYFEFLEALSSHDRARVRAAVTDDFVFHDRRRAGLGLVEGADAYLETLAALWDLTSDIEYDAAFVLALERHGLVVAARSSGTLREGGGVFERPVVSVSTVAGGRLTRLELFDVDAAEAALARLAELRPDPLRIQPNAATRAIDRWVEALRGRPRDWEALDALCAPTCVFEDRQRASLTTGGREMVVANLRLIAASGTRVSRAPVATSGDRLALERVRYTAPDDASRFEIENLVLTEVDAEGRIVAVTVFDPDDRRAASREMLDRHARREGEHGLPAAWFDMRRAVSDHDLERCRSLIPADFVFQNHRRSGPGRVEGADAWIAWLATLFERSRDATVEDLYFITAEKHGSLTLARTFGTLNGGGEFESVSVSLWLYRGGRPAALELFEPEYLDAARARFEELRPDPLRIPPNAAVHARDRTHEAWVARDWAALRSLMSEDFTFEDRGKRALVSGDIDVWIESQQFVRAESGARVARELIGTAGDRIALERILCSGGPAGGPVELEHLRLTEVDAEGRLRAVIRFDLDDRVDAFAEAQDRFVAGEAAAVGGQAPFAAARRALGRHDWDALRSCLAPDLVFCDHRALGMGTLGPDQWVESLRVRVDLAPDADAEWFRILAWNCHGCVSVGRAFGTLRDGGPFENVFVVVALVDGDRIQRFEIFDIADADRALARFEELCAGRP